MCFFLSAGVLLLNNNLNAPFLGHMSSYPAFSGVRVDQSFSFCVVFSGLVVSFVCFALSVFQFFSLRLMITPFVSPEKSSKLLNLN
jgi:hypothetical protein